MHLHGSSHEAHCLRFAQKHWHLIRVAQCRTPCRTWHHAQALPCEHPRPQQSGALTEITPLTSTTPLLTSSSHGDHTCADSSNVSFGPMAETTSPAGYEPKNSHWRQLHRCQTDVLPKAEHDVDFWYIREHCDHPFWIGFGRWSNSEYAGFTAVYKGERSKCWPITSLSLFPRKLSVQFISFPWQCRETCRSVLTQKKVESRHIFRQRRHFLRTTSSSGKGESLFRFSDLEEAARTVLEEQRDHQLAEAKSEILKQECKVNTLNTCIREFQRQVHSNRLEMGSVNCGYEESRREQARLHEELAQWEKAVRDTRIRNIHEVEELKRAQEMRFDEFSRRELRESHATFQELTSQIQELQERMIQENFKM